MAAINVAGLSEILCKPSRDRMEFEIRAVCGWLREKVKYFKKLKDEVLQILVTECLVERIHQDKVIIWEGEEGNCMYILLSGKLNVHRLNEPDLDAIPNDVTAHVSLFPDEIRQLTLLEDHKVLGQCLATLESGHIFGEVALIEKCVRSASIVATETCDVVIIPRDLYNETVASVLEEEFLMKQQFIESVPYFACCSPRHRRQLLMAVEMQTFDNPAKIVTQGKTLDGLHFIMSGEVRLSCNAEAHSFQYDEFITNYKDQYQIVSKFRQQFLDQKSQRQLYPETGKNKTKTKTKTKSIDISLLNPSADNTGKPCLCDAELLLNLPNSLFTASAQSHCVLLTLHYRHYERIILRRYPESLQIMLQLAINKFHQWTLRENSYTPPFLFVTRQLLLAALLKLQKVRPPITLENLVDKLKEINYRYCSPPRGPLIDLYGPGSSFYYIKNQFYLRQQKMKHNLKLKGISGIGKKWPTDSKETTKSRSLLLPSNRSVIVEKKVMPDKVEADSLPFVDHKLLENRIANFLCDTSNETSVRIEPLVDNSMFLSRNPKRGSLIVIRRQRDHRRILDDPTLSTDEAVRLFLQQNKKLF